MKKRPPRKVPPRNDYYMGIAFWIASKSKDPDTQIGSLVITKENKPLGWGYNGPPADIPDEEVDWSRPEKYDFVQHAEENAIDHSWLQNLEGCTLFVTAKPCKKCMLKIISHKIKHVVYYPSKPKEGSSISVELDRTDELAKLAGVKLEKFTGNLNWMRDRIQWMESLGIFS